MAKRRKRILCKKTQPQATLAFNKLVQLRALFEVKHWEIEEGTDISCFDRYVKMLSVLNESQQVFMMDISKRFLRIPQSEYLESIIPPVKSLRETYPDKTLVFTACLKKEDIEELKSPSSVLYQIKGTTIKTKVNLGDYKVIGLLNANTVKQLDLTRSQIVLVDDFVGTGETASKAVKYVHELLPEVKNDSICVLCIVTMQNGKTVLENQGIRVFNHVVCKRGISDYYTEPQLDNAIAEMQGIEKTLQNLRPEYRFGYMQSEALVCMERCPNNTFPIYWLTKGVAPYER